MGSLNIWVILEYKSNKLLKVSREVLSEGRRLADKCGGELTAVLPGYNLDLPVDEFSKYDADKVMLIEHTALEKYGTLPLCGVLGDLIQEHNPAVVLFGATKLADDLAPRLAARLKTGLVVNCNLLNITDNGRLEVTRPAYGGQISAKFLFASNKHQLVLITPGSFDVTMKSRQPQVIKIKPEKVDEPLIEDLGLIKADAESIDLTEADLIVSGGRGLSNEDGFKSLVDLAKVLGASVGGTRVAVDNKWIPFEKQLGQTGKIVSPGFLMTLGTSGAIQYTMGFKDSEFIVAVDNNPRAPIFQIADIGVVADVQRLIPALITLLKDYKADTL